MCQNVGIANMYCNVRILINSVQLHNIVIIHIHRNHFFTANFSHPHLLYETRNYYLLNNA